MTDLPPPPGGAPPPPPPVPPPPAIGPPPARPGRFGSRTRVIVAVVALVTLIGGVTVGVVATRHRAPATAAKATSKPSPKAPTPSPTEYTLTPNIPTPPPPVAFVDPDGHFSATYANQPVRDDQHQTVGGLTVTYTQWADLLSADDSEVIAYVTYPAGSALKAVNARLEASVQLEAKGAGGTVVDKLISPFQGFPSIEAVISGTGGFIKTRIVAAGHTEFIVIVTGLSNPPILYDSFAGSFQILNHAP